MNNPEFNTELKEWIEALENTILSDGKEYSKELLKALPKDVDWAELGDYEQEDNTAGTQTFACSGNSCEVVDLTSN